MCQKVPLLVFEFFSVVRFIIFAMFVYLRIIFIKWRRSLSADVKEFSFMRINYNFVPTIGLTNDERCLIRNIRVFKLTSEHIPKLRIINSKCQNCSNSINIWCFAVFMTVQ